VKKQMSSRDCRPLLSERDKQATTLAEVADTLPF
jgi:hypothetical protein